MPDPEYHKRKGRQSRETRQEQLTKSGSTLVEMPDIDHGQQVLEWLHEVGPVEQGPNGPKALSWVEINAWKQATGVAATQEELLIIRQLSREYIQQYNGSDDPNAAPPNRSKNVDHAAVASGLKSMLRRKTSED